MSTKSTTAKSAKAFIRDLKNVGRALLFPVKAAAAVSIALKIGAMAFEKCEHSWRRSAESFPTPQGQAYQYKCDACSIGICLRPEVMEGMIARGKSGRLVLK